MAQQRIGPPAVVVGIGLTGLGMVRSLRDRRNQISMPITAIDSDLRQATAYTRLCSKVHCADVDGEGLVDCLIEQGRRRAERPVLLLSQDLAVLTVARHQHTLSSFYRFLVPSPEVTNLLMDKSRFGEYAIGHGFNVPRTFAINSADDLAPALAGLTFPCVLKPIYRNSAWSEHGYPKGFVCATAAELRAAYEQVCAVQDNFVAQEWIPGNDADIYFCLAYFDEQSRPVATFTGRKLRQWPLDAGNTSMAEASGIPIIKQETVRLFQSLRFRGMGSVEFKRDPRTGEFKIMEPTVGRANLQSETATANGVNLTWIAYANLAGLESGPLRGRRRSAVWVNEYTDLQSGLARVRRGDLSFGSWVHSYRRPRYYAWFSWSDPMPAVVMGLRLARKAVIRGVQSIFGRSTRPESSGAETVPELSAPSLGPQR
jgi:predicted ATP-grasp superfamily ATP-dependent carboligase